MNETQGVVRSIEELPAIMSAKDVEKLGFSRPVVYRLFKTPGFPCTRVGRRLVVRKERFVEWLDSGGNQKEQPSYTAPTSETF